MDEKRRAALDHRAKLVADTRQQVERMAGEAQASVRHAGLDGARGNSNATPMRWRALIVERVLGRKAS